MTAADDTFGAWFIGNQFSITAFGFLLLQCWIFIWKKESLVLKLVVSLALILGFLHIFLISHALYHYLITSIGNPEVFTSIVWSFKAEQWVSEANITLSHLFYIFRIYSIRKSFILPGVLLFLTLSHTALDLTASGIVTVSEGLADAAVDSNVTARLAQTGIALDLTIDIIVMLAMFHFFYTSHTEVKSTQNLLHKLTLYTFASGSLTVVANIIILVTYLSIPNTEIFSGITFVLPHLYSNCLLAILNSRSHLRASYGTAGDTSQSDVSSDKPPVNVSLPVFVVQKESASSTTKVSEHFSHGTCSFGLGSMVEDSTGSQMPGPEENVDEAFAI